MKNTINYQGYSVYTKNRINLQKALFNRNMKDHRKPKLKLNLQINNSLIENVKTHLSEDKYREILQNSFGNSSKKEELKTIIHKYVSSKEFSNLFANQVTEYDFDDLSELLVEKISGLDVLQPLADIDTITDIKIIAYNNIWVDDIFKGKYKTDIQFESHNAYLELCHRFAFASNKNISVSKPSIDAIFPYMRVNIVGEDLSPKVTTAIRKVSKKLRLNEEYMIETNYANQLMIDLLKITFGSESHLIAGSTGSGKTE